MSTTLNTRLVLRNDSTANWLANGSQVLLKGEVGIEFLTDGSVKMKVGDGTKTWDQLPYFGGESAHVYEATLEANETKEAAIARVVGDNTPVVGDIAIVKALISGDKYEYTAFVCKEIEGGTAWAAMDGNYNAGNVYFDRDLLTTVATGNITLTNGQATIAATGKNLYELWETIHVKEDTDISVTKPSVTVSGELKYLEVGSSGSQNITVTYEDGKYEYGYTTEEGETGDSASAVVNNNTTGADVTGYILKEGSNSLTPTQTGGNTFAVSSGTKTAKGSMSVKGSATYDDGYIPVSNLKKMYPDKAISAGTTDEVSKELFRWYIPMYYGFKYGDGAIADPANITADQVKALGGTVKDSTAYNATKPTSVTATGSWRQFFVAIPASYNAKKPTFTDSNGLPSTVEAAGNVTLTLGTASIEYNVWYVSYPADYDTVKATLAW